MKDAGHHRGRRQPRRHALRLRGPQEVADALHALGCRAGGRLSSDPPIRTLDNRTVTIRFTDELDRHQGLGRQRRWRGAWRTRGGAGSSRLENRAGLIHGLFRLALPHDDDAERAPLGSMLLKRKPSARRLPSWRRHAAALDSPRNQRCSRCWRFMSRTGRLTGWSYVRS